MIAGTRWRQKVALDAPRQMDGIDDFPVVSVARQLVADPVLLHHFVSRYIVEKAAAACLAELSFYKGPDEALPAPTRMCRDEPQGVVN
jgi:hypothetical protein